MKRILLTCFMLAAVLLTTEVLAQNRTVTGRVTGADDGLPLPQVTVLLKGTSIGTPTDADGNYRLNVPEDGGILLFRYLGYVTQEIVIDNRTVINVELQPSTASLGEVVVTGYGTQSKRNLTSSVSQVTSEDIGRLAPVATFENALAGRAAGVQVTAQSGVIGAPVTVRIRGTGSINSSSQPLYVVDGIILNTGDQGTGAGQTGLNFGGSGTNPLQNINPQDIESIEVLKDAAATAIYGSRGSNGVVLISTKKGKNAPPQVSINYAYGISDPTNTLDVLNGSEYVQLYNAAVEGRFGDTRPDLMLTDNGASTDFVDLLTRTGVIQQFGASVVGGNEVTKYFVSLNWSDTEGFIDKNKADRYNFRINLDQSISKNVTFGLSLAPSRSETFRIGESNAVGAPWTYAYLYYPNVSARNDDGSPNMVPGDPFGQFPGTPLSNMEGQGFTSDLTQILASTYLDAQITPALSARTTLAIDFFSLNENRRFGALTTDGFGVGSGDQSLTEFLAYTWTNIVNYSKVFNSKHDLTVLLGNEIQTSDGFTSFVSGNSFPDDRLITLASAATIDDGSTTGSDFTFTSFFTRVNYAFNGKYLFGLSARADGSSRFGANNRWGFFPSASAGWIISDEDFLSGSPVVSNLKLRGSYGITGNANIGNFASRGLVAFGRDYAGVPGFEPNSLGNPDLTWEESAQLDVAVDFGLFDNVLSGTVGYYNRTTNDLLLNRPLPVEVGTATTITENIGSVRNQGIEIELSADIFRGDKFSWTTSLNVSTLQNEVLELADLDGDGEGDDIINGRSITREGEELGAFYLITYAGVDRDNGDALYLSTDGNENFDGNTTNSTTNANRTIVGSPFPDYFGGWTNNFSYKGFDLNVFFQFTQGNQIYRSEARFYESFNSNFNQITSQLNYWTPENRDTDIPQPRLFQQNGRQHSTRFLDDGSFIRLKNVTLGYNLPAELTKSFTARVYVTGQNLWTLTDYQGFDPEVGGSNTNVGGQSVFFATPQARTILFGVNLNF